MGILLALGFALRGRSLPTRAFGSAALVILAPTLYFTYGRGGWLALAAGLAALLALERDRLGAFASTLAFAIAPAVAVVLASRTHALTNEPGSMAAARHDGRVLAAVLLMLIAVAAFVPVGLDRFRRRISVGPSSRRALAVALALAVIAIVAAGLARVGGPQAAVRRAYHAFNAPAPLVKTNESERLLSLSGNNRSEYWHVAWREFEDHPSLGGGAGSFQRFWLRHRRVGLPVLDAHSLYLETLAELGPLGFALLLCALAVPFGALGAARSARRWEPWSAEPWRLLGEAQLQAGSVEQARTSFLRGIRKDRGDWELWLDLALATRGSERQAALGRVATLNPLSTELRDLRGSP